MSVPLVSSRYGILRLLDRPAATAGSCACTARGGIAIDAVDGRKNRVRLRRLLVAGIAVVLCPMRESRQASPPARPTCGHPLSAAHTCLSKTRAPPARIASRGVV